MENKEETKELNQDELIKAVVTKGTIWGTNNLAEFEAKLRTMNMRELRELAERARIVTPSWHEQDLRGQLIKAFRRDPANVNPLPEIRPHQFNIDKSDPTIKKLFNI